MDLLNAVFTNEPENISVKTGEKALKEGYQWSEKLMRVSLLRTKDLDVDEGKHDFSNWKLTVTNDLFNLLVQERYKALKNLVPQIRY